MKLTPEELAEFERVEADNASLFDDLDAATLIALEQDTLPRSVSNDGSSLPQRVFSFIGEWFRRPAVKGMFRKLAFNVLYALLGVLLTPESKLKGFSVVVFDEDQKDPLGQTTIKKGSYASLKIKRIHILMELKNIS